jgi:DNA-binding response OmpR family regulator
MNESLNMLLCILEDDDRQIAAIKHVVRLEFPNADLRIAVDGEECLHMLFDDRVLPDIAILDINTPKLDGLEVLSRLRGAKQFEYLPIIMFTTSDSDIDRNRARELGATDYVVKPPIRSMGSALRRVVEQHCINLQKPDIRDTWEGVNIAEAKRKTLDGPSWDDIDALMEDL